MNNYDKMKELIKENKLKEALLLAFSNSLKIKISTKSKAEEKQELKTVINLLKGITNRISDPNLINNYQSNSETIDLFNFHEQQKQSAYKLWEKNRETIVAILQIIAGNSLEINNLKKKEEKVISLTEKPEDEFQEIEQELDFEDNNNQDNFAVEENPLEEENWVSDIVDDIVGETEEEIASEDESSQEENWDDFVMEEENQEAEVIIEAENTEEEENWDEFMDDDGYSEGEEDSIVNSNGVSLEKSSEEEGEWQEWLEEEDSLEVKEEGLTNNEIEENESSNLEVGDEWQEWLEEENTSENENIEEEMDAIDWSEDDWEEEKVN